MIPRVSIERIEERLEVVDLSASAASKNAGLSVDFIRNIQNGKSAGGKAENIGALARVLQCSIEYLLGMSDDPGSIEFTPKIPVVGYVGAGGSIAFVDAYAKGDGMDEIEPEGYYSPSAVAVVVRGDSMYDKFHDGDIIVYDERREDVDNFVGRRECIVGLADERIMVKRVTRGSEDGLYTLTSSNHPPIEDVALMWCARIRSVKFREE